MRFRIVLAVSLMVLAVCVIVYEIVYLKYTSDNFSDQLNNIIEHLTNEDYQNAVLLFESFQKDGDHRNANVFLSKDRNFGRNEPNVLCYHLQSLGRVDRRQSLF